MIDVPILWQLVLLTLLGAALGTQVNRAIFAWCWYLHRPFSPWATPAEGVQPRRWFDFLPIAGWWFLRRNTVVHGTGFWFRPAVIELACAAGLPAFRWWYYQGGPFPADILSPDGLLPETFWYWSWVLFAVQSVLIFLMLIATVIDLDEKTIPDQVTVVGALLPLVLAAFALPLALPIAKAAPSPALLRNFDQRTRQADADSGNVEERIAPLVYASPDSERMTDPEYWLNTPLGLAAAWLCVLGWTWGLLPKTLTLRKGWLRFFDLLVASVIRPKRQRRGKIKLPPRSMPILTRWLLVILPLLLILVFVSWSSKGTGWTLLSSSLLGLAIGGGLVWAIRIVASYALGQEAMGFGDVTLMAMIGAYLGWQPALLVFAFAPFAAIVIAVTEFILTRRHEIAFGPYLCLSAVIVILFWDPIWNRWAGPQIFVLSDLLLQVVVVGVLLMGAMLLGWGWVKRRLGWMPG